MKTVRAKGYSRLHKKIYCTIADLVVQLDLKISAHQASYAHRSRAPGRAPGRDDKRRSSSSPTAGAAYRPKTAVTLRSGRQLKESSGNRRKSSHSRGRVSGDTPLRREHVPLSTGGKQLQMKRTQQPVQAGAGSQESAGSHCRSVPKASTRVRSKPSLSATPTEILPQIPHGDPSPMTAGEHAEQGRLEEGGPGHEGCSKISSAPAATEPTETLSERPFTAPSIVTLSSERGGQHPLDCNVGVDGVADEATTKPTSGETAVASPGWASPRSSNDGDRRSESSTRKSTRSSDSDRNGESVCHALPKQRASDRMTRPHTTPAVATRVGASFRISETFLFDAEPGPPSLLSRRPSTTAATSRRPTIEADAALSRSSLLPPPSAASAPSLSFDRGYAILGKSVVGGSSDGRRAEGSDGCEFLAAGSSEDRFSSSTSGATGATWTKRWYPGDSGDLDVGSDCGYGESSRLSGGGVAAGWTNNGAATGAGWRGEDQVKKRMNAAVAWSSAVKHRGIAANRENA